MRSAVTVAAGCALAAAPFVGRPAAVAVAVPAISVELPVHVSVADSQRPMGEVLVAADPTDPRRLLACAMTYVDDENRVWVSAYLTVDGGRTWRRVVETRGAGRRMEADPACTFGRGGRAYLTSMSNPWIGSFGAEQRLLLFRSLDGGASWMQSMSMVTTGMAFDREFLVVDNTGGPRDGTLYMNAIARAPDTAARNQQGVGLWVSRDHALTFAPAVLEPEPAGRTMLHRSNGVVLSDGSMLFLVGNRLSVPRLQSASAANARTAAPPPDAELRLVFASGDARSLRFGDRLADVYMSSTLGFGAQLPWLAVDPGSDAFRDRLYVAWSDARSGRSEILLTHSRDQGQTWSAPVNVNDDHGAMTLPGAGEHSLPVVAANRRGVVGVMWYDRRAMADSFGWDVRFAASLDGGRTFLPSVQLSQAPSGFEPDVQLHAMAYVDERLDTTRGHGLQLRIQGRQFIAGDTAGLAVDADGAFHPVWIDHRTGVPQVWTTTVRVGAGPVREDGSAASLMDVSGSVRVECLATSFDRKTGEATVTIALRNVSSEALALPLTVKVQRIGSELAESVDALNADNVRRGADAEWMFDAEDSGMPLQPQAATASRQLRFRLTALRGYRRASDYRTGLVDLHVRVLAPMRP